MKKDKKVINQNLEKSQEELLTQEKEQEEQISFLEKNRKGSALFCANILSLLISPLSQATILSDSSSLIVLFNSVCEVFSLTGFINTDTNKIKKVHTFDRRSMSTVFPFFTSEIGHEKGIPLGFNRQTGLPILFDNFSPTLTNYNMVIFGKSGAGKGVTIKTLTASLFSTLRTTLSLPVISSFTISGSISNKFIIVEKEKKDMPTIGSWYARILRKAEENKNLDYRFHYSYLIKVMRQYVRAYNGQMAYLFQVLYRINL